MKPSLSQTPRISRSPQLTQKTEPPRRWSSCLAEAQRIALTLAFTIPPQPGQQRTGASDRR